MSSVQSDSWMVMWIMGVMNKPHGLMINHDSLELPLQEGVWTWSTCLIQLLVSPSCLSSFPPFFPTQWPEEISLQKCTTYHICVVLMCIANFPKDDLWLDFFFFKLFFTALLKVWTMDSWGDPLWSLWGQNYFYYDTNTYNTVSLCCHLH